MGYASEKWDITEQKEEQEMVDFYVTLMSIYTDDQSNIN